MDVYDVYCYSDVFGGDGQHKYPPSPHLQKTYNQSELKKIKKRRKANKLALKSRRLNRKR